ncbi:MAG: protein kinase [Pyrinomonadaceae bacterium]
METDNWQEIETLFHAALLLKDADSRAAYLARECSGNALLQREVESLIAAFETERSFMEQPALSLGIEVLGDAQSGSLVGQSIDHYRIVRLLGRGGMGEVYLAEDSRLERHVALKFLTHDFFDDDGRGKRQLAREAKAVALLEHPNICAVYGIEEADQHNFIVMQFVEGQTLDCVIGQEPLKVERILALAEQIASALSAAHARGIIHRDVKPQNIMVTASGQIKVLDFGLAKLTAPKPGLAGGAGDNPSQISQQGLIIGTIAYMSPEQLRAEALDYRSDVFSFGIVLDEMLRGKNCFKRASEAETISAILSNDPLPVAGLPAGIGEETERITRKCLKKNREERYQSADELLQDVSSLRREIAARPTAGRAHATHQPRRFRYYASAASLALIIALLLLGAFVNHLNRARVSTLAILPFVNESADSSADYLSDGLTQSLTDRLSRLSKLRVKSPTVVSIYKDQKTNPAQAGRELNVETVLTGKIVTENGALFLRASLSRTVDGSTLWERNYRVEVAQILTAQDEIISHVTSNLGVSLSDDEKRLLTSHQTDNAEAVRLYMLGQYYWKKRDRNNIQTAIDLFEKAIEADPLYAQAHAGLANSYVMLARVSYGAHPTREVMAKARAAAKEALKLDYSLSEAHTSLGIVLFTYDWDWREAEARFKQAIELKPDYPAAHFWYSNLLTAMGRFDEALRESEVAREIDPFSPAAIVNVGSTLYNARQFDRATAYFKELLAQNPDDPRSLYLIGLIYLKQNKQNEAIEAFEKIEDKLYAAAPLGYAYAKAGRRADALRMIEKLEEFSSLKRNVPPMEKAIIHIGLNDKEKAFKYLEEAYEEHFVTVAYLKVEPIFDDLRADPRFYDLIRRINLSD